MFELVKLTKVLFPRFVNCMKKYGFFKSLHYFFRFRLVCRFQIHRYIIHTFSVSDRNHYIFIHVSLIFIYLFDYRISNHSHTICLTLENLHSCVKCLFRKIVFVLGIKIFFSERSFHRKCLKYFHLSLIICCHI